MPCLCFYIDFCIALKWKSRSSEIDAWGATKNRKKNEKKKKKEKITESNVK